MGETTQSTLPFIFFTLDGSSSGPCFLTVLPATPREKCQNSSHYVSTFYSKTLLFVFLVDSRNYTFIVPVVRLLLLKYHDTLPLTIYMPTFSAADRAQQQAQEDFLELMETKEFKAMMTQQIYPGMKQYENAL